MKRFVCLIWLFGLFVTPARAAIIEINFSGVLSQLTAFCGICGPYTAHMALDIENGNFSRTGPDTYRFSTFEPNPPLNLSLIELTFSPGIGFATGIGFVEWNSQGFLSALVYNGNGNFSYKLNNGIDYIQTGPCGSVCAYVFIDKFSVSGVPAPLVGAGIPGAAIMLMGVVVAWRRKRRMNYGTTP